MAATNSIAELLKKLRRPADPPTEHLRSNEVAAVNPPDTRSKAQSEMLNRLEVGFIFSEFHMTIRLRVTEITRKQLSMLLKISVAKAVNLGVDVQLYLTVEYLYTSLIKSGVDPLWTSNEKDRQALLLAELILAATRGTWFRFGDVEKLPESVVEAVYTSGWLPNNRTLQSWKQHWKLESYLELLIVPVDIFLERQPNSAERYTGYTKGYGQDGSPSAPHRTKDEPADGTVGREPPSFTLLEFETYRNILENIERTKSEKRRTKV